jgi:hypothetical protein
MGCERLQKNNLLPSALVADGLERMLAQWKGSVLFNKSKIPLKEKNLYNT